MTSCACALVGLPVKIVLEEGAILARLLRFELRKNGGIHVKHVRAAVKRAARSMPDEKWKLRCWQRGQKHGGRALPAAQLPLFRRLRPCRLRAPSTSRRCSSAAAEVEKEIFVLHDLLAQHFRPAHGQISSGDHTEYHTTLSRTRSDEERDGAANVGQACREPVVGFSRRSAIGPTWGFNTFPPALGVIP